MSTEQLVERLKMALGNFYDKWENGTPCQEADEDGIIEGGSSLGNAVKLSFAEEQEILNLIVDTPEPHERACANCGKPYRAHLLHDGNKCSPEISMGGCRHLKPNDLSRRNDVGRALETEVHW